MVLSPSHSCSLPGLFLFYPSRAKRSPLRFVCRLFVPRLLLSSGRRPPPKIRKRIPVHPPFRPSRPDSLRAVTSLSPLGTNSRHPLFDCEPKSALSFPLPRVDETGSLLTPCDHNFGQVFSPLFLLPSLLFPREREFPSPSPFPVNESVMPWASLVDPYPTYSASRQYSCGLFGFPWSPVDVSRFPSGTLFF